MSCAGHVRLAHGDSLYVENEVLEVRPSKSQADRGLIRAHDDVQSKRRAGANVCRQPSRSAPVSRRLNVPPT
jgi:acyl dehydratase